jgi:hypothetical protein
MLFPVMAPGSDAMMRQVSLGDPSLSYQALADAVLVLHFGIVLFVVLGLPAILIGNRLGWVWVNRLGWRAAHLAAIGVVILQAWLGQSCVLTDLESSLRIQAGQAGYRDSFIAYWLQRVLYYQAPMWVVALAYAAFGLLVAWAWWRYPPWGRFRARGGHATRTREEERETD